LKSAILFADIAGSTQLYEKLGDVVATDCVNRCLRDMSNIVQSFNGIVVKTVGDEIMCRFDVAQDAVEAAVSLHEQFSTMIDESNVTISFRIGIHYGDIVERDNDIFGDVVNIAARMTNIATANQIITTDDTIEELSSEWKSKTRLFDRTEIKGKSGRIAIHEVIWETQNLTMIRSPTQSILNDQSLKLIYQGAEHQVFQDSKPFMMGRSSSNNLVINAPLVSRIHAYCVYRRGKFILIDQSTNGSFVKTEAGREIYVRREETPLIGCGVVGLGESTARDNQQIIQYVSV